MPEIRHQIGFQGIRRSMPEGSADDWPGDSGFQHMRCRPVAENVRPSAVTWVLSYIGFLVYTEGDVCNRLAGKAAVRLYFRNENMPVSTAGTTGIHVIKDGIAHCWAEGQFYQHSRLLLGKAQKLLVPVNKINLHACNVAAAQAGIKEKNANGPVTQGEWVFHVIQSIADLSSFFVCQILDGLAALPQLWQEGKDSAAWGIFPKQAGLEHSRYILLIGTSSGQAAVVGEEKCEHIFFGSPHNYGKT